MISQLYPFKPLRLANTPKTYNSAYLQALSTSYTHFQKYFSAYYSPVQATKEEIKRKYEKFQAQFQILEDKIVVKSNSNTIPFASKQSEMIRTLDTLFRYTLHPRSASSSKARENSQNLFLEGYEQQGHANLSFSQSPSRLQQSIDFSEEEEERKEIFALPVEILQHIFKFSISDWQSVGRLALTCKNFLDITKDSIFLNNLFENCPSIFPSISHPRLGRQLLSLTNFNPSHFGYAQINLNDAGLMALAANGAHLKSLTLMGNQFTPQGLARFLQSCPELQSLEFRQCQDSYFDEYIAIVSLYAKKLEHLKISDCNISDRALFTLAACSSHLRSFEYENHLGNSALTDYGFIPFLSQASRLESIKILGCPKVTQASLVNYIEKTSDSGETKGNQLYHLKFSYCGITNQMLFNSIAQNCPHLQTLELGFSPTQCLVDLHLKGNALCQLTQHCVNLSSLKLFDCKYLNSFTLHQMLAQCQNLQELELVQFNDKYASLFNSLANCQKLQHLKLQPIHSSPISSQSLATLKNACPRLESLTLFNSEIQENQLISYLRGSFIKQLQLIKCGTFGSPLLAALSKYCTHLTSLEIEMTDIQRHPQPFDDSGIEKLARGCPSLTLLTLKSTGHSLAKNPLWKLSALSLEYLAHHCVNLSHLNISHLKLLPSQNPQICVNKSIEFFTGRCLKMTHLGFPHAQLTEAQALSLILPYQHQLQGLSLESIPWLTVDFITQLAVCSNLQYLWFENTSKDLSSSLIELFPFLIYLNI